MRRPSAGITRLRVLPIRASATSGRLVGGGFSAPCAIGRSGISRRKREGDGASPVGTLRILGGYYRPDRFPVRPRSALPLRAMSPLDGWCDEAGHPAYNRPIRLPSRAGHERLWRDDGLYDVVLVLDWNLRPRRRDRGSAIFLHLARPGYEGTAGCVALARPDLLRLLAGLAPGATIRIG